MSRTCAVFVQSNRRVADVREISRDVLPSAGAVGTCGRAVAVGIDHVAVGDEEIRSQRLHAGKNRVATQSGVSAELLAANVGPNDEADRSAVQTVKVRF